LSDLLVVGTIVDVGPSGFLSVLGTMVWCTLQPIGVPNGTSGTRKWYPAATPIDTISQQSISEQCTP